MAAFEVQHTGFDEVMRNLARLAEGDPAIAGAVLFEEATDIMGDSVADYAPRKEGILAGTGHVQPPKVSKRGASVTMGYGSLAVRYAKVQHESLHFRHRVGQAKYLERPLLASKRGMNRRMAARVHRLRKRNIKVRL